MNSNVEKAIAGALDQHAEAVKHVIRWTDALTMSISGAVLQHLSEKLFVSETMRIRVATMASELANDFVDVALPKFIFDATKTASMDVTVFAGALDNPMLERIATKYSEACIRALDPQIRKALDAQDRRFASQPLGNSDSGPSYGIDLGAHAADMNKRFALEDARAAAPKAAQPVVFHEESEAAAIERTASVQRRDYPARKGGKR